MFKDQSSDSFLADATAKGFLAYYLMSESATHIANLLSATFGTDLTASLNKLTTRLSIISGQMEMLSSW